MAGSYKRQSDKARGKSGRWTGWYCDRHGKTRTFAGTTDKVTTDEMARRKETEERLIREGLVEPARVVRREAAARPLAAHVGDYHDALLAKGDTAKHARSTRGMLDRLLASASVRSVGDLAPDRIAEALGRIRAAMSPATHNAYLAAIKGFLRWLESVDRIEAVPKAIKALRPANAKEGRKRVRRVPAGDEWGRLLAATEAGPTIERHSGGTRYGPLVASLTGPDRAMLYRVAAATGLRANELRSLTPESFRLEGDEPCVVVAAAYSKRRREDRQPIPRALAAELRAWLAGRAPGDPAWYVPEKMGKAIRDDLGRAGIKAVDEQGRVLDFHALRHYYITSLVRKGVRPNVAQRLARHSTVVLTLETYTATEESELRDAIEGE